MGLLYLQGNSIKRIFYPDGYMGYGVPPTGEDSSEDKEESRITWRAALRSRRAASFRARDWQFMKNKLIDLNNHLFAQLERLGDEDLTAEQMEKESARTNAIVKVSEQIIGNATIALRAAELTAEYGGNFAPMLPMVKNKDAAKEPIPTPCLHGLKNEAAHCTI